MSRSPSHAVEQSDSGQNLYAILGSRSREHSLPHLVVESAVSVAAGLLLVLLRPQWWALYLPFSVVACYAVWGLLDRVAGSIPTDQPGPSGRRLLLIRRGVVSADLLIATTGTLAALALLFLLTGYLLGNWIH